MTHYSLTMAAFGAGGLAGAIGLLAIEPERDRRTLCSVVAAAFGLVVMLSALNRWHWGVPALFALAGASMTASNASANSLLQAMAPVRLRGQTVSLFMLAVRGGTAVGAFLTGICVNLAGVREALFVNGLLAVGVQLLIGRAWTRMPTVRPPG